MFMVVFCVFVFLYILCVFVFLYILCVFVLACVSLRESLTCDLSSCSSEAPPNSHLGREVELGGERRRQPVLRRISGEDFLLAASSSHKSHACKVSLTGESTDSLGYFLRKRFFFHICLVLDNLQGVPKKYLCSILMRIFPQWNPCIFSHS